MNLQIFLLYRSSHVDSYAIQFRSDSRQGFDAQSSGSFFFLIFWKIQISEFLGERREAEIGYGLWFTRWC